MPHLPACKVRILELVALSSTMSRRRSASCGCRPSSAGRSFGRRLHGKGEMKCRPLLRHAFHPHLAAHHFNQALADGQAETRAAILARGRGVNLAERLEQAGQAVDGNADAGVAHGEVEVPGIGRLAGFRRTTL